MASERSLVREVETEAHIADELTRIRRLQAELRAEPRATEEFDAAVDSFVAPSAAAEVGPVLDLLRVAQQALLRHPDAASFVFQALVDEGRSYAATGEGSAAAAALADDPRMAELRRLWEATSLNVLGHQTDGTSDHRLPSGWIDMILDAAAASTTDRLLEGLGDRFTGGAR